MMIRERAGEVSVLRYGCICLERNYSISASCTCHLAPLVLVVLLPTDRTDEVSARHGLVSAAAATQIGRAHV